MILVTGANGQLGFDVIKELRKRVIKCIETIYCGAAEDENEERCNKIFIYTRIQ